jgi:hypothetical protein
MRNRRFILAVSASCLVAGLGAGAAYAYFTSTGSGSGGASVGSMQTVTLATATDIPTTPLLPGGTGDVTLEVDNPNSFPVTLISVTQAPSGTITADGNHSGCTTTGVTFTNQTGLTKAIPAGGKVSVDLPGAVSMATTSPAGCEGATFSIPVTITAQK